MQLSTAIRLGAMLRPQGFRQLFTNVGGEVRSCALGAAAEAMGCTGRAGADAPQRRGV